MVQSVRFMANPRLPHSILSFLFYFIICQTYMACFLNQKGTGLFVVSEAVNNACAPLMFQILPAHYYTML